MDNYNSSSSYPYNNHGYGGYPPAPAPAPYSSSPYPPSPNHPSPNHPYPNHPYPPANSPYLSSPYPPPTNQPYPPTSSPAPYPYYQNTIHTGPTSYGYPAPALAPPLPNPHSGPLPSEYTYPSPSHSDQYPNPSVYTGIQASSSPSAPPLYHQQGSFHLLTPTHHTQPSISSPMSSESSFNNHHMSSSFHMHHREDSASSLEYGHYRQDSTSSDLGEHHHMGGDTASHFSHNRPSLYPQIDGFSKLHIAEAAASAPILQSTSSRYEIPPLNSWEAGHSGPVPSPSVHPVLIHSNTFPDSSYGQNMQIVPVGQSSSRILLLHGYLDIWVFEAKNLPNMDMFHKTIGDILNKIPVNISNRIEGKVSHTITSDPYVSITIASAVIGRTFVISNSENPVWKQHFYVPVAHNASDVQFIVKDSDVVGSQLIGVVSIPIDKIISGSKIQGSFPILNNSGKPCKPGASLSISIQYAPLELLKIDHLGVRPGPNYSGVAGTYFPLRKGGKVTLYQDAHVPDGCLPLLKLGDGMQYVHGKCWHDIFIAISQAKRLIYITGWSIWHKVKLVRDGSDASKYTLGDILKRKSQEGVRVLLLIWDDPTSRSILGYKTDGVMQTHDEETRRFFKDSSVKVLLCPRIAGKRHSWVKQQEVGTIYTHHQKTVIVDTHADNYRRRIMAFVGGLDLCDGRYDTPHHPIFSSLQTVHKDDYHNPTYSGSVIGCPREPWHDLHSKIDGPAAYDVLTNFEQRWLKASTPRGLKKLKKSEDDALLKIERMPEILGVLEAPCLAQDDPESWHVQIFRSIDSNSVKGFPKDPKHATNQNLVCGKNVLIDMSIHTAYVKAIRSAQRFIYIENQYFLGSSYNWNSHKELGANNLIPMEIALKIAEKIRENQRFAVYIIVPMWPEGNPNGAATQRILYWQHKTMQMMYEIIYKALLEAGLEDVHEPQDFLNFFCLGNREAADSSYTPPIVDNPNAANNTPQALSQKSRRFMIYVHSKGMIVDDEYVIIGSANINQRSMEGTRDTEIAMGAYQPQHTSAKEPPSPRGQIYGYRMSLMVEHLGLVEDCFAEPESIKCVHRIRQLSEMNWRQFSDERVTEMRGHLMKYPVEVNSSGKVTSLPGHENFPDVGGKIIGSFLAIQENLTI